MPNRCWLPVLAVVALAGAAAAQADVLTGVERTEHFAIHFRPGSRSEAAVDRVLALVEDDLARILRELGLASFPHTIDLFLYDDVDELQKLTGVPSAGHSSPLQSHVPCDNDQTRVHELVHVVAEKFSERGPEPRNLFFAEGLANAVLRFVHGVPVDAVAAFYLQRKQLPPLAEVHAIADFYAWLAQHPGFNGYDVAGSWMRYLLDTEGAAKVRRYYCGVPAKAAFGKELAALERGWHERLRAVRLRPGLLALLAERAGVPAAERNPGEAALDDALLGPAASWQQPAALAAGAPGRFEGGVLQLDGKPNDGDWCVARLGDELGDAMVRCTATAGRDCFGVQLQIGGDCQGMLLRGQGAFLYCQGRCVAHAPKPQLGDAPLQLVLRRVGDKASLWVDGKLVLEGKVDAGKARFGAGCVGGAGRFTGLAARKL